MTSWDAPDATGSSAVAVSAVSSNVTSSSTATAGVSNCLDLPDTTAGGDDLAEISIGDEFFSDPGAEEHGRQWPTGTSGAQNMHGLAPPESPSGASVTSTPKGLPPRAPASPPPTVSVAPAAPHSLFQLGMDADMARGVGLNVVGSTVVGVTGQDDGAMTEEGARMMQKQLADSDALQALCDNFL
eukprot:NODE_6626_length_628_cov_14.467066_g6603_i0.p1 GENE.NODE_6626_length_628_cov_14.467066_g6603_i0~~NODE_6626_length_628_cov_14.467066_g6603_i0.p1  ORF type:complete len:204 (+),score=47.59 NODE_6626_length_628_cov_14.467066_g6603_i0:58-612(+)